MERPAGQPAAGVGIASLGIHVLDPMVFTERVEPGAGAGLRLGCTSTVLRPARAPRGDEGIRASYRICKRCGVTREKSVPLLPSGCAVQDGTKINTPVAREASYTCGTYPSHGYRSVEYTGWEVYVSDAFQGQNAAGICVGVILGCDSGFRPRRRSTRSNNSIDSRP